MRTILNVALLVSLVLGALAFAAPAATACVSTDPWACELHCTTVEGQCVPTPNVCLRTMCTDASPTCATVSDDQWYAGVTWSGCDHVSGYVCTEAGYLGGGGPGNGFFCLRSVSFSLP